MERLIDLAVDRYRTVLALLTMIFIIGVTTFTAIPKEAAPDVKLAMVYVSMTHDGISPEDAEKMLLQPMERYLRTVEGVDEMTANASLGHASVMLKFDAGFDSDIALNDVRAQVDLAKAELPAETDEPKVTEIDFSLFPVLNIMLAGDIPERSLLLIARELRDRIEEVSEVLEVTIAGNRDEVLEVIIDPVNLQSYGISTDDINRVVQGSNQLIAAGAMDTGKGSYQVKVPSLLTTRKDIMSVPVSATSNGVVTVGDIAEVRKTFRDAETYAKVNGKPGIVLSVRKRVGRNILETVEKVREVVEKEREFLPSNLEIIYSQDQSDDINSRLSDLVNNLLMAVILVFAIVVVAVGFRTAGLVAISVPGSFLIGIIAIGLMGHTLNIVVLFALIMAVGMLVDAAIIVAEDADVRLSKGEDPKTAYTKAAKRMLWPAFSSVLTTLIVFLPLLFWPGTVGQFMKYMPITLIVTLSGSFLMAVYAIPAVGAWLAARQLKKQGIESFEQTEIKEQQYGTFTLVYSALLRKVLKTPGWFASGIFVLLCLVYVAFAMFGAGVEFFPKIEPTNSIIKVKARGNFSIDEKDSLVMEVANRILDMKEVKTFFIKTGQEAGGGGGQDRTEDIIGEITIEFVDWQERRKADEILAEVKERTKDLAGIVVETAKQEAGPPVGKPIYLQITSRFPELIQPATKLIRTEIEKIEGLKDVEDSLPLDDIEWRIDVDRSEAGKYAASVGNVGQMVQLLTKGLKVSTYRTNDYDDEIDILLRYPEDKRSLSYLDTLKVTTESGEVPISNFVTRKAYPKTGTIYRAEGARVREVKADLLPDILAADKLVEVQQVITRLYESGEIDKNVRIIFKGEDEEQQEAANFLRNAFLLALASMFILLLAQFNSYFAAIVIMSAVFLSTVGVVIGLLVTNQPFGIVMCGVGVIALGGIVVGNNIIFIDTYRNFKEKGMNTLQALEETGKQRLRPILLTAGTTVVGLLPMVFKLTISFTEREITYDSPSSQWWTQLSTSIAGGLTFATILTLFFTPALILIADKFGLKLYGEKYAKKAQVE